MIKFVDKKTFSYNNILVSFDEIKRWIDLNATGATIHKCQHSGGIILNGLSLLDSFYKTKNKIKIEQYLKLIEDNVNELIKHGFKI